MDREESLVGSKLGKANCAGQGCPERRGCRRYQVRILGPSRAPWEHRYGLWVSADLERQKLGSCALFVKWRPESKG
jgi:hypothetical protein